MPTLIDETLGFLFTAAWILFILSNINCASIDVNLFLQQHGLSGQMK